MKKLLLVLVLLFACGCVEGIYTDSDTGEQIEYKYIDPNVADKYEDIAEDVVGSLAALTSLLPWLAPFVAAGGGILATWKKLKPALTAANKEKNNLVRGGTALSQVLEDIKINHPDTWARISPAIHDSMIESGDVENAIKEFRRSVGKVIKIGA